MLQPVRYQNPITNHTFIPSATPKTELTNGYSIHQVGGSNPFLSATALQPNVQSATNAQRLNILA